MTMASPAAAGGVLIGEGVGSGVTPSSSHAPPSAVPSSPSIAASPHWAAQTRRKAQKDDGGGAGFSPFVAFCFSVNYVLGTGFLTIPWAFVQGGLALSAISLLVVCVFADVAKDFLLETMARAEAMLDEKMRWVRATTTTMPPGPQGRGEIAPLLYSPMLPGPPPSGREGGDDGADDPTSEGNPLLLASAASYKSLDLESHPAPRSLPGSLPGTPNASRHGGASAPTPGEMRRRMENLNVGRRLMVVANKNGKPPPLHAHAGYLVRGRKFEINALCRVFLGRRGKDAYMLFLSAYLYCALWAYASVFASAMARQFPLQIPVLGDGDDDDDGSYAFYAIAFASVVVPMSCLELHEQVTVQVLLTMCRFLMVFLMVVTGGTCADEQRRRRGGGDDDDDEGKSSAVMFRPSGLHRMLPVVVFAMIYHHSIPGLAHPVADKRKLGPIFVSTTTFCALAYCFIGFVLGSAFGDDIEQSANLNWASYRGGGEVEEGEDDDGAAWSWSWAGMARMYVVLFPALDVLSAYPLNAITLGNNMLSAFYGRRIHEVEKNRWVRIPFRLLASMPPIVLAILVRELGTITDYAGTTGFVLTFSFSALLYVRSRRAAAKRNFSQETYYTTYASSYFLAYVLFVFGVGMLVFCIVLYVMNKNSEDAEV